MPELPDLQVFSRNLNKRIAGKSLIGVKVAKGKLRKLPSRQLNVLKGQKLQSVDRVGKELHFTFKNGRVLGIHLMLRGELFLETGKNGHKYTLLELLFKPDLCLVLTDPRSMAQVTLDPKPTGGIDALSPKLTSRFLQDLVGGNKGLIKSVLMEQHIISGIGNAYADEILYEARISPFLRCDKITTSRVAALARSIKKVLKNAERRILKEHPGIIGGEYRDFLSVHTAHKMKSPSGGTIQSKSVGGRKTYYTREQILYK